MDSQVSSSSRSRLSRLSSPRPKPPWDPASRCRSRTSREAVDSGFSIVTGGAPTSTGGASVSTLGSASGAGLRPLATSATVTPTARAATTAMTRISSARRVMALSNQAPIPGRSR